MVHANTSYPLERTKMTLPTSNSPPNIICYQCRQTTPKPFGKIVATFGTVHLLCSSACLEIALEKLKCRDSNNLFTKPVSIKIGTPYPFNLSEETSPIQRSPKMKDLHKLLLSDSDCDSDHEGLKQLQTLTQTHPMDLQ